MADPNSTPSKQQNPHAGIHFATAGSVQISSGEDVIAGSKTVTYHNTHGLVALLAICLLLVGALAYQYMARSDSVQSIVGFMTKQCEEGFQRQHKDHEANLTFVRDQLKRCQESTDSRFTALLDKCKGWSELVPPFVSVLARLERDNALACLLRDTDAFDDHGTLPGLDILPAEAFARAFTHELQYAHQALPSTQSAPLPGSDALAIKPINLATVPAGEPVRRQPKKTHPPAEHDRPNVEGTTPNLPGPKVEGATPNLPGPKAEDTASNTPDAPGAPADANGSRPIATMKLINDIIIDSAKKHCRDRARSLPKIEISFVTEKVTQEPALGIGATGVLEQDEACYTLIRRDAIDMARKYDFGPLFGRKWFIDLSSEPTLK